MAALALFAWRADAQTDAGVVDAGAPDPCDPRCVTGADGGPALGFCDQGEPRTIECAPLGGRCGELSPAWGDDCLLPVGAACDPGYGFGDSRCDRAASLFCVAGVCTVGDAPTPEAPLEPTPGTTTSTSSTSTSSDPFNCESCTETGTSSAALFAFALVVARRRARRGT